MSPPRPPKSRPGRHSGPTSSRHGGPTADRQSGPGPERPRSAAGRLDNGQPKNARPGGKPQANAPRRFEGPKLSLGGAGRPEKATQERNPHDRAPREPAAGRNQRQPAVPAGAVWLYGTHAVGAALANPARRLRRLVMTEDAQASLAAERPQPWPIQPEFVLRERIDQLLGARPGSGIVHQGVALLTDQLTAPPLLDALKRPGPILVLDQISDPRNIGALMRTAQAFGAAMVIAQERNAPEETGALAKVASGALELIPLLRIVNISRALLVLKSADVWVVGLDGAAPDALNGAAFAGRRVALVLGNEGEGMRRLTRETCDEIVALGMPGGMESLNVSAAGAVALYELTRALNL
jgi:23S rRNA (guanosine2251-2'-O)-methyltransferase